MKDPSDIYKNFRTTKLKRSNTIDGKYSNNGYYKYIVSKAWAKKSAKMRKEYPFCYVCKTRDNLRVHHKTYKRLKREKKWDLIVLCADCHDEIHTLILNDKEVKLKNAHKVYKKLQSLKVFNLG